MKLFSRSLILIFVAISGYLFYTHSSKSDKKTKLDKISETIRSGVENEEHEREEQNKLKEDNPDKFAEYLMLLKTGESGKTYKGNYKLEELKKARQRLAHLKKATVQLPWKERGPGNVGGRTRSIVIDPKDASGNTWLAGSVSGGVWRTTDAGSTWTCISPDLTNLATGSVVISLDDPNVIYAGTGEGFYNVDAIMGAGIFKSTDNGATWIQLQSTKDNSDFYYVNRIITDPDDVNCVIAVTNKGAFKSIDGGGSWVRTISGRAQQIICEKDNFSNQYLTINNNGIYKSTDKGDTWFKVKDIKEGRIEMAVSPTSPGVLYALSSESNLYMSVDNGYNWVQDIEDPKTDFLNGQGWYDNTIVVSPGDSNILYVGGIDVYKIVVGTDDAGGAVRAFETGVSSYDWIGFKNFGGGYLGGGFNVNDNTNDFINCFIDLIDSTQKAHRFVYDGNKYVFKGLVDVPFAVMKSSDSVKLNVSFIDDNDNGVFDLTENSDEYIYIHTTTYTGDTVNEIAVDNGYNVNNMYSVLPVMQPGQTWDPGTLSAVQINVDTYDLKGKAMTSEKKTSWSADISSSSYSHADHHGLVIDDENGNPYRILDCNDGGIAVSDDGGENWISPIVSYVTSQFYSVSKHPTEDRYLGGMQDNGTWYSTASTGSDSKWDEALGGDGFGSVWHSRKPDQMIASLYYNQLFRTDDNWVHLYDITEGLDDAGSGTGAPFITTIASSPDDPDLIFIAGPSGLWRSENFGIKWNNIHINSDDYGYSNGSVYMEISKADPKIVWVGVKMNNSGKLNVSVDKGKSFSAVNNYDVNIKYISRIVSDPFDPGIVYVLNSAANSPKIIRSKDMGQTWEDISGFGENSSSSNGFPDVATFSMLVMPYDTNILWAGTEIGLFISEDNGQTWHYSDNGLPAVCIWDMKIVGDQVVMGTHGRGIWSVTIPELANVPSKPYLVGAGATADNRFRIRYEVKSDYDSIAYYFNEVKQLVKTGIVQGINDVLLDVENSEGNVTCQVVGYKDGKAYRSNLYSAKTYQYSLPRVRYFNDFEIRQRDFYGTGFIISDKFDNTYAINSDHPYPQRIDYTYTLKYPVIVMADDKMSVMTYEDIAFVEEGEPGSVFGDEEFYDYVVVEASKDGIEWLPLADGYDIRYSEKWGDDENATPSPDMFVSHNINFQDTFAPGDTILIRFRLFSDPYTVGWGWVIDNVNIQQDGSGIFNRVNSSEGDVWVTPNPATDKFVLGLDSRQNGEILVKVYDLSGKLLSEDKFIKDRQKWTHRYSVSGWSPGVKIINVFVGSERYSKKIVIRKQ